jgi:hypothetical protein
MKQLNICFEHDLFFCKSYSIAFLKIFGVEDFLVELNFI